MASAMALSSVSVVTGIGMVIAMAVDPLGLVAKFGLWKILGVVFAFLNLKNIPSFWHVGAGYIVLNTISPKSLIQCSSYECSLPS